MEQYYYQVGEKVLGPHTIEQLNILKSSNVITPKTLVCKAGTERWTSASAVLLATSGIKSASSISQGPIANSPAANGLAWKPSVAVTPSTATPMSVIICYAIAALSGLVGLIMLVAMARADDLSVVVYQIAATVCLSDALVFWLIGCGVKYAFEASALSRANSITLNQILQAMKSSE